MSADIKQQILDLMNQLDPEDVKDLLDSFTNAPKSSIDKVESVFDKLCPSCGSAEHYTKGKTKTSLTVFKCKNCGRQFNILSDTPLSNTPYSWSIWVTVLEKMLTNQSIIETMNHLIHTGLVEDISEATVSAMR